MTENEIGTRVIEAAIAVDRELGPGLLETVYEVVPAHRKQVQTYLKLTGCKLGYLLNFGDEVMRTGITRCVTGREEPPLRLSASAGEEEAPTMRGFHAQARAETLG